MRLSDLHTGQSGHIIKVLGHGGFRRRIMEMGFVRGRRVEVILNAPLKDPIKYGLMGYEVSLRRSEAAMIEVEVEGGPRSREVNDRNAEAGYNDCADGECETAPRTAEGLVGRERQIEIALVGNPNSGKSSLYNALSGSHEHVGNYSGVTVEGKRGAFSFRGYEFIVYDLPGTYALSPYSPEELYVRRHLTERIPDVIVNVAAASNLERNLYLTTELIDIAQEMVMALNMYDELEQSGATLDVEALETLTGVPIVPVVARDGRGLDELLQTVIDIYEHRCTRSRHVHINYGVAIEDALGKLRETMAVDFGHFPKHFSRRYLMLKFLEGDDYVERMLAEVCPHYGEWTPLRDELVARVEKELGEDIATAVTGEKYGFVAGALRETLTPGRADQISTTAAIDAIVTHKLWGFPVFFLLMWLMFEATFKLGQYPMGWIEGGVEWIGGLVGGIVPAGALHDLLVDGIIGGVGSVIVFLPNILILFLCISFMEDSGYMARAAFIMDKVMHRIGLHGKSFIPLVMGFGCNVPGIMAARAIESRSSRIITVLISPFISCSARLPIYIMLTAAFFPSHASLVLISIYVTGIVMAALTALLLRRTMFKRDDTPFVMELPPYRLPTLRTVARHMWGKGRQYLRKMGGVILVASIAVWLLSYYPRPSVGMTAAQQSEQSWLGRVGRFVEPAMRPIGIPWKGTVALVAGVGAKEVTVSTLGVLYSAETKADTKTKTDAEPAADGASIESGIDVDVDVDVEAKAEAGAGAAIGAGTTMSDWTPLGALSFMIFALLYFPCLAALAAIRKEAGGMRWVALSVVYNTLVAWVVAFAIHAIGGLFV
ncbi:MAG: ferrous iron transport protein B, partial [Alistipes sp.]|nr:ferrous iron transport protein B [Alistipes sp.]